MQPPLVQPRTIDDVPVVAYTLFGERPAAPGPAPRGRRAGAEIARHPRVASVWTIGGLRRVVRVDFDRERLASFDVSILQAYGALRSFNWRLPVGAAAVADQEIQVDAGEFLASADDVAAVVVSVRNGQPGLPRRRGHGERRSRGAELVRVARPRPGRGREGPDRRHRPPPRSPSRSPRSQAPTPSTWSRTSTALVDSLEGQLIPCDVELVKTRDYGATPTEKANELLEPPLLRPPSRSSS